MVFRNPQSNSQFLMAAEHTVFPVNRNKEFRLNQGQHSLQVFPCPVSGYVYFCIFTGNHMRSQFHECINSSAYADFIARNRRCGNDNRIPGMNLYLTVASGRHTGQACHRFALTPCSENHQAVIAVPGKLFRVNKQRIRHLEISQFSGNLNNVDHGASKYTDFPVKCHGGIHSHLNTGNIGCKGCQNNTASGFGYLLMQRVHDN